MTGEKERGNFRVVEEAFDAEGGGMKGKEKSSFWGVFEGEGKEGGLKGKASLLGRKKGALPEIEERLFVIEKERMRERKS